ncbi:MAG: heavy-metal-associated domain-containing protein [Sphingobacterium sp.]
MENNNQKLEFKTNINCGGCVSKVKPALDSAEGIADWKVDIDNQDKILSVHAKGISQQEVIELVKEKGFKAEPVS